MIVGGTVATGLYAALGVGVGAIVRNQVGAVVGTLVYLFVLENLLQIIKGLRDPLAKYGFAGVGQGLTGTGDALPTTRRSARCRRGSCSPATARSSCSRASP